MTDLFGEWMNVMDSMDCFSRLWHFPDDHSGPKPNDSTYLFCTKRVERMCDALRNYTQIPHAYFGFTSENQEYFLRRGLACADMPEWAKLWVSVEPMLGPVDLLALPSGIRERIKWVVVGCESGQNRRPCKLKWIEDVVYQCIYPHHSIPVFVKQLDINGKCERDITKFPAHLQIRQVPWATKEGAE
jgi:protein gp37